MITPDGMKERFEFYQKWFNTFLVKEFMNLPLKEQEKFILLTHKFMEDCKKVNKEAHQIKEKIVIMEVKTVEEKQENFIIIGYIAEIGKDFRVLFPASKNIPKKGDYLTCTLFSINGKMWYSSKKELITEGV